MIPKFCSVDIIDKCVLKCKMCYKWADNTQYKDLPAVCDWHRFIDSLRVLCADETTEIVFAGGETFLYEPIFDIIGYAGKKGFTTAIASSGYLLDDNIISKLADAKLAHITLSLDSLNKNTHDSLRGRDGVFDALMRAIDKLHAVKINICISVIIMDVNLNEIINMAKWALGNDKISAIIFLAPIQPNSDKPQDGWHKLKEFSFLWPSDIDKTLHIIDELKSLKKISQAGGRKSKICNSIAQLDAFNNYFKKPDAFAKASACSLASALHISSVGDMFFCYMQASMGNIKDSLVHKVWDSQKADSLRESVKKCEKNCHFLLNCYFGE